MTATQNLLYQIDPPYSLQSKYPLKGWTETVVGHNKESAKLSRDILQNRKLGKFFYTWHVTINIELIQTAQEVVATWKEATTKLDERGIIAIWLREPTTTGGVHYHLLLRNNIERLELERVIRESMFDQKEFGAKKCGWHMNLTPVEDDWKLVHYITKAKVPGYHVGKYVEDYYAEDRLLFKKGLGLKKCDTIGQFWVNSRKWVHQTICDREKRIADGLSEPGVQSACDYVYELLGRTVERKLVERSFGYHSSKAGVRHWIMSLSGEGNWTKQTLRCSSLDSCNSSRI